MDLQLQLTLIRNRTCSSLKESVKELTTSSWNNGHTSTVTTNDVISTLNNDVISTLNQVRSATNVTRVSVEPDNFPFIAAVIESVLMTRVVPVLCAIGLVGNIVTLVLLASHSLRRHLGRMEKFAASGLAMLAATDALFCMSVHPLAFVPSNGGGLFETTWSFRLIYSVYHNAVVNMFIVISSWITVTLAIVRYIAVCHPLWARYFFGPTAAARVFTAVIITCVVLNVPHFFIYRIETASCQGTSFNRYFRFYGWLRYHPSVERIYWWVDAVFGALIPFCLLAFTNVNLIRALRQAAIARAAATGTSHSIDKESTSKHRRSGGEVGRHVTLTLVIVVALYLLLVTPAVVINVLRELFPDLNSGRHRRIVYNLCVAIVNTLQAANFSLNFLIYCVINARFRRKLKHWMQSFCSCCWKRVAHSNRYSFSTTTLTVTHQYHMVHLKAIASERTYDPVFVEKAAKVSRSRQTRQAEPGVSQQNAGPTHDVVSAH